MLEGGSCDEPTLKTFDCKYSDRGCDYFNSSIRLVENHEKKCTGWQEQKKFYKKCTKHDGCEFVAESTTQQGLGNVLQRHKTKASWTPKQCEKGVSEACNRLFMTKDALRAHNSD